MEYEVGYDVRGSIPECGAIFMSNISTKRECFKRKLLGLPSAQANFVKQIKVGMVLFLFEFERRELYGVFRACSDGSTNIVPDAYISSGKSFPAQVRFTPIWYCDPLTENEFRNAIKENYYSKKKFNFGLSEDQVHRLLCLFSSRKLQKPLRPVGKMVGKSMGKERGITGDDDYFPRNKAEKFVEDDSLVSGIDAKYPGNASSNNGRKLDINRFMKNDGIQNNLEGNRSQKFDILPESLGVSLGKRRRDDDNQFSMQDSMAYDHELDRGLGRGIQINHPGDCMDLCCSDPPFLAKYPCGHGYDPGTGTGYVSGAAILTRILLFSADLILQKKKKEKKEEEERGGGGGGRGDSTYLVEEERREEPNHRSTCSPRLREQRGRR